MRTRDDPIARATLMASRRIADVLEDVREARVRANLTQESVAKRVGISRSRFSRIERHEEPLVPALILVRICAAVGLDLPFRAYAGPGPLRDSPQVGEMIRLRERLGPAWQWQTEVRLPIERDQRAWDAVGSHDGTGLVVWVELETRVRDSQALLRRISGKQRDGGATRTLLVVPDTRNNRDAIRAAQQSFSERFPADMRRAMRLLARGEDPGADVLLII